MTSDGVLTGPAQRQAKAFVRRHATQTVQLDGLGFGRRIGACFRGFHGHEFTVSAASEKASLTFLAGRLVPTVRKIHITPDVRQERVSPNTQAGILDRLKTR